MELFTCSVCQTFECLQLKDALRHIAQHKIGENIHAWCPFPGCNLKFQKYNTLYKHCKKNHADTITTTENQLNIKTYTVDPLDDLNSTCSTDDDSDPIENDLENANCDDLFECDDLDYLRNAAIKFLIVLRKCKINNADVNNIMAEASSVFDQIANHFISESI